MEDRTKFDLEKSIEDWKSSLLRGNNMSLDNITELEVHLQDEISGLQNIGLSEEECFLVAKKRMGATEELTTEYGKVNRGIFIVNRIMPYLKGILLYVSFLTIAKLLTNISALIVSKVGINVEYLNSLSIGSLFFLTSILFVVTYMKYKNIYLDISKGISIPVLVSLIIIGKLLTFLTIPTLTNSIGVSSFGTLQMNFSIYNMILVLLILIISCVVSYSLKRQNRMKIAV
jgi:hypothetical protein